MCVPIPNIERNKNRKFLYFYLRCGRQRRHRGATPCRRCRRRRRRQRLGRCLLRQGGEQRLRRHVFEPPEMTEQRLQHVALQLGAQRLVRLHIGGGRGGHDAQKGGPIGASRRTDRVRCGDEQRFGAKEQHDHARYAELEGERNVNIET